MNDVTHVEVTRRVECGRSDACERRRWMRYFARCWRSVDVEVRIRGILSCTVIVTARGPADQVADYLSAMHAYLSPYLRL